uniref:Alpha-tubulin N-acetyltransferase n=2 Tax=Clastoptera arizonana TaxID=38151 RepID=A0A1B6D665_9HEMI
MEYVHDLFNFLPNELIIKIDSNLLPENFHGDRHKMMKLSTIIHEILDSMGIASAKAQGLLKPITSGDKLRNSSHAVYLSMENYNNKKYIVGLLKMGQKNLYLYDGAGNLHERKTMCVLDFYIHETKQRMGHGKVLYDYMLQDLRVIPHQLAIDKPSENFLSFLYKHYGLHKIIPQSNNYVLFQEFFDLPNIGTSDIPNETNIEHQEQHSLDEQKLFEKQSTDHYRFPSFGRHAAFKQPSSIGQILDPTRNLSYKNLDQSGVQFHHKRFYMDYNL